MAAAEQTRPPNIVLLITDQQRATRHWPEDPGWLRELMPNEAELARTGLSFTNAFCNTAMCSPSRSTLFTGLYPARHGVPLTLTAADLKPDPAQHAGGNPRADRDPPAPGLPAPPGASRLRPRGAAPDDGRGGAGALALRPEPRRNAPLGRL